MDSSDSLSAAHMHHGTNLEPTLPSPTDEPLPVPLAGLWREHSLGVGSHHDRGPAGSSAGQSGEEITC